MKEEVTFRFGRIVRSEGANLAALRAGDCWGGITREHLNPV